MKNNLENFKHYLINDEKSTNTIRKYSKDVADFLQFIDKKSISKELVLEYKQLLMSKYATRSVNSKISAVNKFLEQNNKKECKIKLIRVQKQLFIEENKELTIEDYKNLLITANNERIGYIIQTLASTGIRISELVYFTVESIQKGSLEIKLKGKSRCIFISSQLKKTLIEYAKNNKIETGPLFISKNNRPLNRSDIWKSLKKLAIKADINPEKVYPHNFRHLFAHLFYSKDKDLIKLADVLGHSSINTTRIYLIDNKRKHQDLLDEIGNELCQ